MKNQIAIPVALSVLAAAAITSGCVFSIGSHRDPCPPERQTQGQQLIDLKKAHDEGALTDAEYESAKARVLAE